MLDGTKTCASSSYPETGPSPTINGVHQLVPTNTDAPVQKLMALYMSLAIHANASRLFRHRFPATVEWLAL